MFTKFIFRNFKSFRDDTTLDLSASKITEYADHLFDTGVEKVYRLSLSMEPMQVVNPTFIRLLNI